MKRLIAALLTFVCLFSFASVGAMAEDRPTVSYYAYWCGSLEPGSYVETYVEDMLNMNVEVRKVNHTDKEAVNLMLATGDMPDCGWFEHTYAQMSDEELIRSIPVDMMKEYVPGYIELCDQYPILYELALDPDDPTQFRYLPDFYAGAVNIHNNCMYLRYDWIQKLGIDLGVNVEQLSDQLFIADNGISRDVFEKVLDGFVNGDPDGNGKKDTFGLLKDWAVSLVPSQGILYGANMEVDGKPVDWYANPETKELLLYVQKLYSEGLVYPEIFTVQWGEDWELVNQGKAGVLSGNAVATVWLQAWANNRPPRSLFAADPNAQMLMIPGVAGPDGEVHHVRSYKPTRWENFYVNADVTDEHLVDVLKFFNGVNFPADKDAEVTMDLGEKGVDWEWNEDGSVNQINILENGEKGTKVFNRNIDKADRFKVLDPYYSLGVKYYEESEGGIWNPMLRYTWKVDLNNSTQASDIEREYSKDWASTYNAYFMDVIMGKKNVDSDWDAYMKKMNDLKYGEYVDELNKAPTLEEIFERYKD